MMPNRRERLGVGKEAIEPCLIFGVMLDGSSVNDAARISYRDLRRHVLGNDGGTA
ncbi:MAG: hypothetical protein USCGTAYLOR_02416 [Chromatiales bacterium USCg_Taylor]|nr:MAG: hypothetical protein USCGTAYLOR_02416 [Chromatiales bacterium USCg_Taylor]